MTPAEFKSWLEGYLEAGGDDISKIKEKVDLVYSNSFAPSYVPSTTTWGPITFETYNI